MVQLLVLGALSALVIYLLGVAHFCWMFAGGCVYATLSSETGAWQRPNARKRCDWFSGWVRRFYRHHTVFLRERTFHSLQPRVEKPCLYLAGPHGFLATSMFCTFLSDDARNDHVVVAVSWMARVPILGHILQWGGCIPSTRAAILHALLVRGRSVAIVPEGTAAIGTPFKDHMQPYLGAIRIAVEQQCAIRPVYFAGESRAWALLPEPLWLTRIRSFTHTFMDYPFPTLAFPRLLQPPRLITYILPEVVPYPILAHAHKQPEAWTAEVKREAIRLTAIYQRTMKIAAHLEVDIDAYNKEMDKIGLSSHVEYSAF